MLTKRNKVLASLTKATTPHHRLLFAPCTLHKNRSSSSSNDPQQQASDNLQQQAKIPLAKQQKIIQRILQFIKPEKKIFGYAFAGLGIQSGISLLTPYAIGKVVDALANPADQAVLMLEQYGYVLGTLFIVGGAATFARVFLVQNAAQRIAAKLRQDLFSNLVKQDVQFYDKTKSGELVNRLSTDVQVISDTLTSSVVSGLRSLIEASMFIIIVR